jgi:hypothetical protein
MSFCGNLTAWLVRQFDIDYGFDMADRLYEKPFRIYRRYW